MWGEARDEPALLRPGRAVRFEQLTRYVSGAGLRVEVTGPRALLQDLGRPGQAGLGVGRSGAADLGALRLANRLVANDETSSPW